MTARLPLSIRANWLTTCAVIVVAGVAATLQPARAATAPDGTLLLPPAFVSAADTDTKPAAKPNDGPRHGQERGRERGPERPTIDKKLTNDQVRDIVAGNLAMRGNANLKTGKVTAKEDGIVSVEIVTKTGALVDTREISTKSGRPAGMERRFGEMRQRFAGRHFGHGGPGKMMAHRGGPDVKSAEKTRDLALTTDQAKKLAEARLIMRGNPHLKIGAVKDKDADTITVDIVAADNSLVTQQLIDRHSGRPQRPFGPRRS